MAAIPNDYIERCYAGWLGKLIGVRFGVPTEGWSYEHIKKVYGTLDNYVVQYKKLFAADDDTNAPIAMISALHDYTHTSDITSEQIGLALLNHAPYEHGFFWWGGYGNSTEHTAYTNLREGIPAPFSGSVEQNGAAVAEQIGGQIFIDPWGLIAPGNPALAAEYAQKAAGVTHGGNGVYGGMCVAAAIAAAFTERDIRKVIETALAVIPHDCDYAAVSRDMIKFYEGDAEKNWESAMEYIIKNWGYDRYPGVCHIIPNAAVMVMSMLYGEGDFSRTICICNMCGWDTDCNIGNIATVLGVMVGPEGIDMKWRTPINDAFTVSAVLGTRNFLDAPWCTAYIAELGYKIASEEIPDRWKPFLKSTGFHYHFELPGSTHGMTGHADKNYMGDNLQFTITQTCEDSASGSGALKVITTPLRHTERFCISRRTHFRPQDFHDSSYDPSFSPLVYPGQKMSVKIKNSDLSQCTFSASLYALDANSGETLRAEDVKIGNDWTTLTFDIPAGNGICIDEIGVSVYVETGWNAMSIILLDDFIVDGAADYGIDFTKERYETWHYHHHAVSQFTYLRGIWELIDGKMLGSGPAFAESYTGHVEWKDIDFTATVTPLMLGANGLSGRAGIGFRVQGAMRSYCAAIENGKLRLMKNENGVYRMLAETPFEYEIGEPVTLRAVCRGCDISVFADSEENSVPTIQFSDKENPYLSGCIGAILANGARAAYSDWKILAEG